METTIDSIGDDLLHNILSRLPALACANAACVNRSWNFIISSLLSSPNLSYARSHWPSLQDAVNESVEKVLSRPIRPQFVIASISPPYSLQIAHQLKIRLQNSNNYSGISRNFRNAVNDEFEEVQWDFIENEEAHRNRGVSLIVGFFPGLKISLIPLLAKTQGTQALMIDELVLNIRACSFSVSGVASPAAILLFSFEGDLYALYVGVFKRRKCSIGMEPANWIYLREFHEVLRKFIMLRVDEKYLYVNGCGITGGDSFLFYIRNAGVARDSFNNASNNLRCLKRDLEYQNDGHTTADNAISKKKSVFGCIMFSCCRCDKYFVQPHLDCSPFMENFPGVTFSRTGCAAEIADVDLSSYGPVSEEHSSPRCCLHMCSTVYLVMSHTPASPSTL